MYSSFDIQLVLDEWRLPLIIVGTLFLAWALWYTSDADSNPSNNQQKSPKETKKVITTHEEIYLADTTTDRVEMDTARNKAIETTLNQPLSLAEEMVALHNLNYFLSS